MIVSKRRNHILLACCIVFTGASWTDCSSAQTVGGETASAQRSSEELRAMPFHLKDIGNQPLVFSSADGHGLTVICFLGTECPLAKLYGPRLERLFKDFAQKNVRFIGLNSNQQDSVDELKQYVAEQGISFPVAKDHNNVVADRYRITRTPEVILVDADMRIRYRGRIDDQYAPGVARLRPDRHHLRLAIEELIAGNPVTVASTKPEGCLLGRVTTPSVNASTTYAQDVAPILNRHCVECHHDGDIGPFSLTDFDEVVGWGPMVQEVIDNGRMPPWHADPDIGQFANQRIMPEKDKQIIRDWVKQGMPLGDPTQFPQVPEFTSGWQLPRTPDVVLAMRKRPFQVPADGTVEYQYFVVDPGFDADVWVTAAEVIPGNRAVVHHSIVFIRPPDGTTIPGIGWLAAYVPGQRVADFNPKRARKIPAGSRLVFQQHYTPNGTVQQDITKIGLIFADDPKNLEQELLTLVAKNQGFELKPNQKNQVVKASLGRLPDQATLLNVAPHMHFRGNKFSATAVTHSGNKTLLRVPDYDFNWQHSYQFVAPIATENLKRIDTEFVFDNTAANSLNPDPADHVTWGDQTWEEMAIAFFDVVRPLKQGEQSSDSVQSKIPINDIALEDIALGDVAPSAEIAVMVKQKTDDLFQRFDKNKDDLILRSELPIAVRIRFNRFDANGDQKVSRGEIEAQFRSRIK